MAPERPGPEDEPGVTVSPGNTITIPVTLLSIPNTVLHIKEGDGASSEDPLEKGSEDDDLTSLTWLQDKNLLKGINLRSNGTGVQESPTSDYVDDSTSEPGESTCSSVNSASPVPTTVPPPKNKHPHHIPYDPQIHITSKPPYSFSCLIFMAIEDSPGKALPVKEIYGWILDHFPFYKIAPIGWKNSVRHNLSLNKCFRKVEKAPNLGKGSLWMVDPLYRPNLLQALQKAPYHPCTNVDKNGSSAKPQPQTTSSTRRSEQQAERKAQSGSIGGGRLPNPELFPYLSRRLAASGIDSGETEINSEDESLDDVDAAAAMLELKHGPNARINIFQMDEYHRRVGAHILKKAAQLTKRKLKEESESVLITSSPSEDHTYSAEPVKSEPTSPDEAFAEGSDSDSSWNTRIKRLERDLSDCGDIEEQRKIAEGADALLNLAGIATNLREEPSPQLQITKKPNTPFRPRLLRKSTPTKHRRIESDVNCLKNRWKPGLITENNNIIEHEMKHEEYENPNKIRRKSVVGTGKSLGKVKR